MSAAREVALEVLTTCRKADAWADGTLKSILRRRQLSRRDGALAARITYAVLQNRMLLDYYLDGFCKNGTRDLEPVILDILRIGACQILLMDKIPHSAAVNEAVTMAKVHHRAKAAGMVNAVLRNLSRSKTSLTPPEDLSIRYSHPKWLVDRYVALLGREEAERCLAANNTPVPTTIQRNPLRISGEGLIGELEAEGIRVENHPFLSDCYEISGTGDLEQCVAFAGGYFMVQDAAARMMTIAAGCRPGQRVIDVCAAPGGKSFSAAMDMGNRGQITACDIHPHKLRLVERGAERLGITCMETVLADGREPHEEWFAAADTVLCDVPCSGLGVIRKKPDLRYKDPKALSALPAIQLAILTNASRYVRPGGVLVYSTCTILPEENEGVISAFLSQCGGFRKEPFALPAPVGETDGEITLWPHRHHTDGFYICKLRKIHD